MEVNQFLTDIAKGHNPRIEGVTFEDLRGEAYGIAGRDREKKSYWISIDNTRLICPYQILFVLFHEVGHIRHNHLEGSIYLRSPLPRDKKEKEAHQWAFKQTGLLDNTGKPKEGYRECFECLRLLSTKCLKGRE